MMQRGEVPPSVPKSFRKVAAGSNTHQNIGEYGSNLNENETQSQRFSDANQWVNAKSATSAVSESISSPSYKNLPPHFAVVLAILLVGHSTYFNYFSNPNLTSWFPATATPNSAVCNSLVLTESSSVFEAVTSVAPQNP